MSRMWVTALAFSVIAWNAYNLMIYGYDISLVMLSLLIFGALLVMEIIEKYQKGKRKERNALGYSGGWEIGSSINCVDLES